MEVTFRKDEKQLDGTNIYEFSNNFEPLLLTINGTLKRIRRHDDTKKLALSYFLLQEPKAYKVYLADKFSYSSYYTGNISSFLDYHRQLNLILTTPAIF